VRKPVEVVGGAYSDDALPWTAQDTCNWLPVNAEQPGARSNALLRTPPGLYELATLGTRHRGIRNVEGKLFLVSGNGLYRVLTNGEVTRCGDIGGTGRVSMTHNQITNGNELVIGTGSGGYVYNTVTEELTRITDDGFPGFLVCDYINSLIVGIEPQRRFFFNSALADALSYNTLERYESEASPDRLRSLVVANLELWLFNERTVEVFDNTGVTNALFQNKRIVLEVGCAATHAVCKIDNSIVWLTDRGEVHRTDGYGSRRISTRAIEQAIARCNKANAFAFVWVDRGHAVYYLTFPDGLTWGYDCSTGLWHRRSSVLGASSDGTDSRWRLATLCEWNGVWVGGEYNSGRLFQLAWDYVQEGDDDLVSERITPALHNHQSRIRLHEVELVLDVGDNSTAPVVDDLIPDLSVSGNLGNGLTGDVVSETYEAEGGVSPYTFSVSAGAVPTGLTLDAATGVLSGTYTAGGTFNWTIRATDAEGQTADVADTNVVTGVLFIAGSAPDGYTGVPYDFTYTHGEGTPPRVVDTASGAVPDGLTLDSDGVLDGTPTVAGDFTFAPRVTDDIAATDSISDTVRIFEAQKAYFGKSTTATFKAFTFAGDTLALTHDFTPDYSDVMGMALSPARNTLFVSLRDGDRVMVYNLIAETAEYVSVGNQPRGLAADADYVYACNYSDRTISKIRQSDNTVVATSSAFPAGQSPTHCCLNSDGSELWITATSYVIRMDTATMGVNATIARATAWGIAIAPDDSVVYIGRSLASNFVVLDPADNSQTTVGLDGTPRGLSFSPDGVYCYVAVQNSAHGVQKITVATNTPAAVVSPFAGVDPTGLCVSHDGTRIIASTGAKVFLLDTDLVEVDSLVASDISSEYCAARALP
jgi:sugar lactone lactonase YvrE